MYNLIDFPNYHIDIKTGKVYSHIGKMKELKGTMNEPRTQMKYMMICPELGRPFQASRGRLIACATYGCSYFKLPKDLRFSWDDEKGLTVRTISESAKRGMRWHKSKIEGMDWIAEIDRCDRELQLIRQAILGDSTPLLDYLYSRKMDYVYMVAASRLTGIGPQRIKMIEEVVDDVFHKLLDDIIYRRNFVCVISPWVKKTALAFIKHRLSEASHHIKFNDAKMYNKEL